MVTSETHYMQRISQQEEIIKNLSNDLSAARKQIHALQNAINYIARKVDVGV